jgi:hypothetical protein
MWNKLKIQRTIGWVVLLGSIIIAGPGFGLMVGTVYLCVYMFIRAVEIEELSTRHRLILLSIMLGVLSIAHWHNNYKVQKFETRMEKFCLKHGDEVCDDLRFHLRVLH